MSADGCFIDAPLILTKERIRRQGVVCQRGTATTTEQLRDEDHFPLPYELMLNAYKMSANPAEDDSNTIAFHFGDLLTHVPLFVRAKWQQYFRGIKAETDAAYLTIHDNSLHRLLFMDFKTTHESDTAMHWWQQRLDKL